MKIDQQFLKDLLITFEDSEGPDTTLEEIKKAGIDIESAKFIFHMRILGDNDLIARTDGSEGKSFQKIVKSGHPSARIAFTINVPLRLTSRGHDFIADLRQQEVWQTIKTNFKNEGLTTLMEISKSLAMGYAKKRIKDLTDLDID
ncbi:DUF2513 domain-containing protein [Erwinia sp. DT-104]|uniref:DUF2513 domain-containing protein n=1 Tax=Erwinia sp. DT-104 TaxID=3396161 RepID=UPI003F1BC4A7